MIQTKYLKFQKDLQQGMSINEACTKHKISFLDAFQNMPRSLKKTKRPEKSEYIYKAFGHYGIRKWINGKTVHFGTYKTFEEAQKVRDNHVKTELNDWHDTIKELEFSIDWIARRISFLRELIRTKRVLMECKII